MLNDALLSDVVWATLLAEIGANTTRMAEAFAVVMNEIDEFMNRSIINKPAEEVPFHPVILPVGRYGRCLSR